MTVHLCFNFSGRTLTAVLFIRGAVVIAVVDSIANIVFCNTAPIVAGELCVGVTWPEQTACLVTVVSTVVVVVTAVVIGHASPIATSKNCGSTGVEGCEIESRTGQRINQRRTDIQLIYPCSGRSFYLTRQ